MRKAPAIVKPPPNNTRLPSNMDNFRPNNNRPRQSGGGGTHPPLSGPPVWSSSSAAMAPPSTPHSHKVGGVLPRPPQPPGAVARGTPPGNFPSAGGMYSTTTGASPQLSSTNRLLNRSRGRTDLAVSIEVIKCSVSVPVLFYALPIPVLVLNFPLVPVPANIAKL